MNSKDNIAGLHLSFDVGHSSIGWAVLHTTDPKDPAPDILGCGTVIFRADDCLASSRRAYRRQRRHIRSTRQRIKRIKILLLHLGVLSEEELNKPGCAWPWKLAAQVLQSGPPLSWPELWDVLRWYAHNRGYDGNRRWSAAESEAQTEDSEKEANARSLMDKFGTRSMAETFCAICGIDPLGAKKSVNLPGNKRPKGQNAAFPRKNIEREVSTILRSHFGKLKSVGENLELALLYNWNAIPCPNLKLPNRYDGGLLFGQLVPRFDNRIISTCPISGQKVPSRNCVEFLNFRWAMQLANIRVGRHADRELRPLEAGERQKLDARIRERGYFTPKEFKDAVRALPGCERDNMETMLMHPDAKEALLVDPVQKLISSDELLPFWKLLPDRLQKRLKGKWRRGKSIALGQIRAELASLADAGGFDQEIQRHLDTWNSKAKKKSQQLSTDDMLKRSFPSRPFAMDGRAAFSRHLLKKAYEEIIASNGHPKEEGGCLFISEEIRAAQLNRPIADQTNNHLVRHRLLILERLLNDIVTEYAGGVKERVGKITIEVNRDLREMSGKTAKEKAQELGLRIANHHAVAKKLDEAFTEESGGKSVSITAGLIRKARIADDLGWSCPYTGHKYEPKQLLTRSVDKDHIVPRSDRASDSLASLVITFSEINKWKGRRTALQFIMDEQGKPVPGLPHLTVFTAEQYKRFVESLDSRRGHDDDKQRKKHRKDLLLLQKYEEKEFVPRDLTQTSQLVRLGAQLLKKNLPHLSSGSVTSLPGSVTGTVRKSWKVLGCLGRANPQVLDENGDVKSKTEIRDITHLHHALDACVLGLASHFIPNNGRVWELIIKRHATEAEQRELMALGVFGFNAEKRFELRDLSSRLKDQIAVRLAEKRVVQHIPARMNGLRVEQNTWGVKEKKEDGMIMLSQRSRQPDGTRGKRKVVPEKKLKLLGLDPPLDQGKLLKINGVLVIPDNFGVAILDRAPNEENRFAIIAWRKVWHQLQELRSKNSGEQPRLLRIGTLVQVPNKSGRSDYRGLWMVRGVQLNQKAGFLLDLSAPDVIRYRVSGREDCAQNIRLQSLYDGGLKILKSPLTGIIFSTVNYAQ